MTQCGTPELWSRGPRSGTGDVFGPPNIGAIGWKRELSVVISCYMPAAQMGRFCRQCHRAVFHKQFLVSEIKLSPSKRDNPTPEFDRNPWSNIVSSPQPSRASATLFWFDAPHLRNRVAPSNLEFASAPPDSAHGLLRYCTSSIPCVYRKPYSSETSRWMMG